MLRDHSEACECFHTGLSPYRYEIHHYQQEQRIEEHAEEHGTPGIPVDVEEMAETLESDDVDCQVLLDERGEDGRQIIEVSGIVDDYEIRVNPHVVRWSA